MAIFKAYLDDSGDPDNLEHSVLVIAGYVADLDAWKRFERLWQDALDSVNVPWFHMKEFGNPNGMYKHIKAEPDVEAMFLAALVQTIKSCVTFCPCSAIRLNDLSAFNLHHGLQLDPYSLAIYGCIVELRRMYRTEDIDIVFDRFDRSVSRVGAGMNYARKDTVDGLGVDGLTPIPLQKHESFKNVLPLQAADFIAWELRKFVEERKTFEFGATRNVPLRRFLLRYYQWWGEYHVKHGRPPRERKSYIELQRSDEHGPSGYIWDRLLLEEALQRHPNGWE